jgi:hypothetical protein
MPASPWSSAVRANVSLAANGQKDAFARLRVAEPHELFSAACDVDDQPLHYENTLSGSGDATYSLNLSSVLLEVTGGTDSAQRQTRQYIRYRPGKSQLVLVTANLNGAEAGVTKEIGYFDDNDGLFFRLTGAGASVVRRTIASGSPQEVEVAQTSWNLDPMDGTGPSGLLLDWDKFQVFIIDFGWLGGAGVRWGIAHNNQVFYVHQEAISNVLTTVFMQNPTLPVRWKLSSSGGAGSMLATCASVQSEGGFNSLGNLVSASRDTALTYDQTNPVIEWKPLFTIRLRSSYVRAQIMPVDFGLLVTGDAVFEYILVVNATLAGGTSTFSQIAGSDAVEMNTGYSTLTLTTGTSNRVLARGWGQASSSGNKLSPSSTSQALESDVPVCSSVAGTPDTLTLAVRPINGGSTSYYGHITFREFV